jgi:hypothetical protein
MTICVRIQNIDARPEAVVRVRAIEPCTGNVCEHGIDVELRGTESRDVYIHKGVALRVEEVVEEVATDAVPA